MVWNPLEDVPKVFLIIDSLNLDVWEAIMALALFLMFLVLRLRSNPVIVRRMEFELSKKSPRSDFRKVLAF